MTDTAPSPAPEPSAPAPRPPFEPESRLESGSMPHGLVPVLLTLLLVAVALIVGPTIAEIGDPGPDEFYYLSYAKTLAEHGPSAIREIFRVHVEEPRHWQFPNPLRVGYLAVAALWLRLDGISPQSLAHLSLACHLLSIVIVYRLVRRELGEARGLAVAVLVAASPLWLAMSRRALQDSFATLAALLLVSAFWSALERPESRRRLGLLAATVAFALVTKESLVLLLPPLALWLLFGRRSPAAPGAPPGDFMARGLRVGGALAAGVAGALAIWIAAAGSFETVRELAAIVVRSPATNAYALRFGGGGWYRYAIDFVALSAGPTLLGIAGLGIVLERARRSAGERPERLLLFLAFVAVAFLAESALLTKNLRYVMLLELPLRLFAVEALWALTPRRSIALRVAVAAAAVIALAAIDVATFRDLFVERGLYDPMSAPILELRGIVPRS